MDISTSFPLMEHTHSYTFSATTQNPLRSNYSFLFITSSNGIVYLVKEAAKTNASPSNPNDVPKAREDAPLLS